MTRILKYNDDFLLKVGIVVIIAIIIVTGLYFFFDVPAKVVNDHKEIDPPTTILPGIIIPEEPIEPTIIVREIPSPPVTTTSGEIITPSTKPPLASVPADEIPPQENLICVPITIPAIQGVDLSINSVPKEVCVVR